MKEAPTKMKFKIPKTIFGHEIIGAMERLQEREANNPTPQSTPTPITNIDNPQDYILLSGRTHGTYSYPDLAIAIEKTHFGKDWHQTHRALNEENARMLTLRQATDFLKLLSSGEQVLDATGNPINQDRVIQIYKDITEVRSPWRSEWYDAYFKNEGNHLKIFYDHEIQGNKLIANRIENLESHLTEDKTPGIKLTNWLQNATNQGIPNPNTKSGDLYYWRPKSGSVARFGANSGWAILDCCRSPTGGGDSLGVRAVRRASENFPQGGSN